MLPNRWASSAPTAADARDAQREEQPRQVADFDRSSASQQVLRALLPHPFEGGERFLFQSVEVGGRMHESAFQQLVDDRRAKAVDIHRVAAGEMHKVARHLSRAGHVDAAEHRLPLLPLGDAAAGGADVGNPVDRRAGWWKATETTSGMMSPALRTTIVSPMAIPFSLMKSWLWSTARLTVVPASVIGSKTAVGVSAPVRPTRISISRRVVRFSSGGYLKATASGGTWPSRRAVRAL